MLGAIGLGLSALGGTAQSLGNMHSSNSARKKKLQGYQNALNDFDLGSTDAQGNSINWNNNRGWGYDLSDPGKALVTNANRNAYNLNTLGNIAPSQARNQLNASDYLAARHQALANQSAAYRQGLRTGSNLSNIQTGFGRAGSSALQQIMQQNLRNGLNRQAELQNLYANNATNAQNLVNSLETGLNDLQNSLGGARLSQQNAIADVKGTPVVNALQTLGKISSGIGQGLTDYDTGNKKMALETLKAMLGLRNDEGATPEEKEQYKSALTYLLRLFNQYKGAF